MVRVSPVVKAIGFWAILYQMWCKH